jgi:hypothetical protein
MPKSLSEFVDTKTISFFVFFSMNFTKDYALLGNSSNRFTFLVSCFHPLRTSYYAVHSEYSLIVGAIYPFGNRSPLLFLYPVQTLISSRSSSKSKWVRNRESSLLILSALWTRFRSVQPKTNSSYEILYLSFKATPICGFSILVGNVFMC